MRNEIVALAQQQAQAAVRRVAVPAAFACVAGVFFLIALVGLFAALFFWLEAMVGPIAAAAIVAVIALVLGLLALVPLTTKRRPKPPASDTTVPQLVSLLTQSAPSLSPRETAVAAFLLAVVLGLMARGSSSGKK
jgi:hypothetical protein